MPHKGIKSKLKQLKHYQWDYLINLEQLEMYYQKLRLQQHVNTNSSVFKALIYFYHILSV